MDFWIIVGGEKAGPYTDYEVRARIRGGDLEPDSRVWREGLADWTRLGEIDLFREEFSRREERVVPGKVGEVVPGKKAKPYFARRFWARWLDLTVYGTLWWLAMYFSGREIGLVLSSAWMMLPMYLPWFVLEAWLVSKYGTTPGKWLMGLRVRNEDGSVLSFAAATKRALRVLVSGVGFGWSYIAAICQLMSWFTTRRIGKPIWDYTGGHKVEAVPLVAGKVVVLVLVFAVSLFGRLAVQGRFIEGVIVKENPEMEQFYKGWRWLYLPERGKD